MGDFLLDVLGWVVVSCALSLFFVGVLTLWLMNQYRNMAEPDLAKIKANYEQLSRSNPDLKHEGVIRKIIHREALKAGVVGAMTSFGGFYTLPIALPVDVLLSTRIQATLVDFIADVYGQEGQQDEMEARIRRYIISSGGVTVSGRTSKWLTRYVLRLSGKSFAKLVPFFGAFVGFAVNYAFTQASGNLALRWYSKQLAQDGQIIISE